MLELEGVKQNFRKLMTVGRVRRKTQVMIH